MANSTLFRFQAWRSKLSTQSHNAPTAITCSASGTAVIQGGQNRNPSLSTRTSVEEPWTLHDLRRTVRTGLGRLGVQPHIAEAVLNHLPPKLIRTYDRNTYAAEKRDVLDKWAAHLRAIVAQATGANLTALRSRDSAGSKKM